MLPIVLNPEFARVGLAGAGDGFERRLSLITEAGVDSPVLFKFGPPGREEIAGLQVLFVAGLGEAQSRALSSEARAAGVLVNVEDEPQLSDFHVPAVVRRGDLLLSISTGGRSPGMARILRAQLEKQFGPEWEERLGEIATARRDWRASGLAPHEVAEHTGAFVIAKGWRP